MAETQPSLEVDITNASSDVIANCIRAINQVDKLKSAKGNPRLVQGCVNEMYKLLKLAKSLPDVPSNFDDITTPTYLNYEGEEVSWESEDEEEVIYEAPPTKRDRD